MTADIRELPQNFPTGSAAQIDLDSDKQETTEWVEGGLKRSKVSCVAPVDFRLVSM